METQQVVLGPLSVSLGYKAPVVLTTVMTQLSRFFTRGSSSVRNFVGKCTLGVVLTAALLSSVALIAGTRARRIGSSAPAPPDPYHRVIRRGTRGPGRPIAYVGRARFRAGRRSNFHLQAEELWIRGHGSRPEQSEMRQILWNVYRQDGLVIYVVDQEPVVHKYGSVSDFCVQEWIEAALHEAPTSRAAYFARHSLVINYLLFWDKYFQQSGRIMGSISFARMRFMLGWRILWGMDIQLPDT